MKFCRVVDKNLPSTTQTSVGDAEILPHVWERPSVVNIGIGRITLQVWLGSVCQVCGKPFCSAIFPPNLFVRSPYPFNFVSPPAGLKLGMAQAISCSNSLLEHGLP